MICATADRPNPGNAPASPIFNEDDLKLREKIKLGTRRDRRARKEERDGKGVRWKGKEREEMQLVVLTILWHLCSSIFP